MTVSVYEYIERQTEVRWVRWIRRILPITRYSTICRTGTDLPVSLLLDVLRTTSLSSRSSSGWMVRGWFRNVQDALATSLQPNRLDTMFRFLVRASDHGYHREWMDYPTRPTWQTDSHAHTTWQSRDLNNSTTTTTHERQRKHFVHTKRNSREVCIIRALLQIYVTTLLLLLYTI